MPNRALTGEIRNLPPLLDSLERDAGVPFASSFRCCREQFRPDVCFGWEQNGQRLQGLPCKEWMALMSTTPTRSRDFLLVTLRDTELVLEASSLYDLEARRQGHLRRPWRYLWDNANLCGTIRAEGRTLSVEISPMKSPHWTCSPPSGSVPPYSYQAGITRHPVRAAKPIKNLDMEALVDAVNSSRRPLRSQSCRIPRDVSENIHPFTVGNGRTGRQILVSCSRLQATNSSNQT